MYEVLARADLPLLCSESDDETKLSTQKRKAKDYKMQSMKAELKHLLAQPLLARGVIKNYITSGSVSIVDDLIAGNRAFICLIRVGCALTLGLLLSSQ